jgi:predicted metallo-beta-lactamase superfamily hydrolase
MRVRLLKNVLGYQKEIRFAEGQEFEVHPAINRFGIQVYEVAEGIELGVMLHKSDCEVISESK